MTHIMVDLETFGLKPGSVIRSIGAIPFNPATGYMANAGFYANITRDSCEEVGLTVDPKTEAWWADRSEEARAALDYYQEPLRDALERFSKWWVEQGGWQFWACGPDFDKVLLDAAYEACGIPAPWKYSAARCTRTIGELSGCWPDRSKGVHHNALVDAVQQTSAVLAGYKKLGLQRLPRAKVRLGVKLKPNPGCSHGPQTWPWWRAFGLLGCRLDSERPSTGWRLWFYTRAGGRYVEIFFDRREGANPA